MNSEGSSAPLLMGEAPDLNASPARSQLRSHAQHLGTPPRVAPPGQVARSPGGTPMAVISPKQRSPVGRLGSLDAVRGMTVCLMIFVDNVGDWFPGVDHSPWDDITLADFVMPYFLFMVGCSMSLSFSKYNGSIALTYKIIWRTVKLFIIGVATQGADLWGGGGFDMSNIRIPGILQRIAWAYCVVAFMSVYLPRLTTRFESPRAANFENVPGPAGTRVFRFYILHWVVSFCFFWLYVTVMLGVTVPTWTYQLPQEVTNEQCKDPPSWALPGTRTCTYTVLPAENITIHCNMRGDLSPKCSAARMVDQWLLGWSHMCSDLFAHRLPQCSGCSPDDCPLPDDRRPGWCRVPFDPEGTLASMPTVLTTWLGMHFGLTLAHHKDTEGLRWVLVRWILQSGFLTLLGILIHFGGWKMNKQLWSPSYLFFMAGTCGGLLSVVFALLDYTEWLPRPLRTKWRLPSPLQAAPPTGPQRDSLDGALRSCIAADETLAEAQEELRARGVGLSTRKRLVALKAEISAVQRELKVAIKDESRSVRIPELVLAPFVWVGMNTIFIYLLAPSGSMFNSFLQWFYWEGDRDDNPASWSYETFFCGRGDDYTHGSWDMGNPSCQRSSDKHGAHTATPAQCSMCLSGAFEGGYERDAQVVWTVVRIVAWMGVAGWLHKMGWYWAL